MPSTNRFEVANDESIEDLVTVRVVSVTSSMREVTDRATGDTATETVQDSSDCTHSARSLIKIYNKHCKRQQL